MSGTSRRIDGVGPRAVLRWILGGVLIVAGVAHLTTQRSEFRAQVPGWFPIDDDVVVVATGIVEIALGVALIALSRHRVIVGTIVAGFFVVVFPGNVAQWTEGADAFGLDTDAKRFARLFFQPVLVVWALGATGAWQAIRAGTWPTPPPSPSGEVVGEVRLGLAELVSLIADDARGRSRYVFGLAGTPGSGKSTVAARVAEALDAVVVPMDGFHFDNTELHRLGLSGVKGAPRYSMQRASCGSSSS